MRQDGTWDRAELIDLFNQMIPNFNHMYKTIYETRDGILAMLSHLDENAELIIRNRSMNLISRQTLLSLVIGKAVELRDDLGEQFFNICLMVAAFGLMLSTHFDKEDEHELYFQQLRIEQLKGENTEEKDYINELEKMMLISTKKPRRIPKDYYKEFTKYIGWLLIALEKHRV
ncbi:hypothetical protein [Butyrivibrio sp. WCE2006]|uniref:hypothetical protein n=1 Tax=Butyrivibrio sp. WCE2006 TaxID=1410611 RepID=UPI0012DC6974|nr:hypothetical protein [Butyrivibrio sp. WCE2006]